MKNLTILLAMFSMGTAPIIAEEVSSSITIEQIAKSEQKLGRLAISEIRQNYENGTYDQFLKELDDSYKSALSKNQLTQLIEMREGLSPDWEKWEDQARRLQELKGRELIAAVDNEEDSLFKEKVISASTEVTTEEQEGALFRIATLRQMAPGTGENNDENRLIDLDLEYEYKSLHLNMPGQDIADQKEKQMALRMDRARKMVDLSMSFEDASLRKDVALYAQDLDLRLAQNWDAVDLNRLANGREKPSSATEEKVISILNQYREEFSNLAQQLIDEQRSENK